MKGLERPMDNNVENGSGMAQTALLALLVALAGLAANNFREDSDPAHAQQPHSPTSPGTVDATHYK